MRLLPVFADIIAPSRSNAPVLGYNVSILDYLVLAILLIGLVCVITITVLHNRKK